MRCTNMEVHYFKTVIWGETSGAAHSPAAINRGPRVKVSVCRTFCAVQELLVRRFGCLMSSELR